MKRWSSWYKVQRLINKEKKRYPNQTITVLPFEDEMKEGFTSATGLHESIIVKIIDGGQYNLSYFAGLILASIIAGMGLITNNAVVVVASMLVSPLMGPILQICMCLQTSLKKKTTSAHETLKKGLQRAIINEIWSLFLCVFIGVVMGFWTILYQSQVETSLRPMWSNATHWPTQEMVSRTSVNGLLIGIAIAIPSGIAIGFSFLDSGQTSLVGVAISASLLPPAVNTGILLSYALVLPEESFKNADPYDAFHGLTPKQWSAWSSSRSQWFDGAFLSFALTLVNIGCIIVTTTVVFYLRRIHDRQRAKKRRRVLEPRTLEGENHSLLVLNHH